MTRKYCQGLFYLLLVIGRIESQLEEQELDVQTDPDDNSRRQDIAENIGNRFCQKCHYLVLGFLQQFNSTFSNVEVEKLIHNCCQEASKCAREIKYTPKNDSYCPATWDGLMCWPQQEMDTTVYGPCPDLLYIDKHRSHCPRFSTRYCDPHNLHYLNVDYSTCDALEFHRVVKHDNTSEMEEPNDLERRCCRTERRVALSWQAYLLDTCARCYMYLPPGLFTTRRFIYDLNTATLRDPETGITYFANWENASHPIYQTFLTRNAASKWRACCQDALRCCANYDHSNSSQLHFDYTTSDLECPTTWDGWQCFSSASPGTLARSQCADHIYFKSEKPACPKYAEKACMSDGRWFFDKKRGKEWTSYRPCGRIDDLRRQLIFHISMYTISVVALLPSLIIFYVYKQLQVYRISMHKNLFLSLVLNGIFSVIFKSIVMLDELDGSTGSTFLDYNSFWCKGLLLITKYFRLSNYMWMFCEGFYLHKLIASAFAEQKNLLTYYIIGWGFPIIPVSAYGIIRKLHNDEQCWVIPVEDVEWVLNGPSLLSLVVNLAFLCSIIRVLVTKLRATHASEPSHYSTLEVVIQLNVYVFPARFWKAVRAALVLVPLFGLHFLLVLYRPHTGSCEFLTGYVYFSHALDGLQGFFVSLTFCYCNGEVIYLLQRSYQRYRISHSFRHHLVGGSANAVHLTLSTHVSCAEMQCLDKH